MTVTSRLRTWFSADLSTGAGKEGSAEHARGWTDPRWLPAVAAAGLIGSYLLSWELWQPRLDPPNLPVLDPLAAVSWAGLLVIAALAIVAFPKAGAPVHAAVLILAVLGDQIRLQPGVISLTLLAVVGAYPTWLLVLGRWHLITLWFWAGLHKLLSGGWPSGGAEFIAGATGLPEMTPLIALLVPLSEIALAAMALWPAAWRILRVAGPAFHVGIVLVLAGLWWNTVVWPWNLALAAAVPLLFRTSHAGLSQRTGRVRAWQALVIAALIVYPAGFYAGYVDAYPAHNLYTSNTAEAYVCTDAGPTGCERAFDSTWQALNVPLPPQQRLFEAWFAKDCASGEFLRVDGIWTRFDERTVTYHGCPD